jgi:hypothetical protein
MSRSKRAVCAIGMASLLLGGCETLLIRTGDPQDAASSLILLTELAGGRTVFYGSVETTQHSLDKAFRKLGLTVVTDAKGGEVRIKSSTRSGARFTLVLTATSDPASPGQKYTHIAVEWENSADSPRSLQLLGELVLPAGGAQK